MNRRSKRVLLWALSVCPALVAALLFWGLRTAPQLTETVFSRGVFRVISFPVQWLVSCVPWSLAETAAVLFIPLLCFGIVWVIRRWKRRKPSAASVERAARRFVAIVSSLLLWYMLLHGVNYYRLPLDTLLEIETDASFTEEELQTVCMDLAKEATALRRTLSEDENGNAAFQKSLLETLKQADDGYRLLESTHPFLSGGVWRVKPVMLSHLWSYTGISGVYFPFFSEANVNVDMPAWTVPFTASHEVAHTCGIAREDECNFLAFLSCRTHPDALYRYSGALTTYIYCANALYENAPERWSEVRAQFSEEVLGDLRAHSEYWDQFRGKVQEVSSAANNAFIQSQGVEDGVLSYNRVVELVLKWYRAEGLI